MGACLLGCAAGPVLATPQPLQTTPSPPVTQEQASPELSPAPASTAALPTTPVPPVTPKTRRTALPKAAPAQSATQAVPSHKAPSQTLQPNTTAQPTLRSLQGGSQRLQNYYQQSVTAPGKAANPLSAPAASVAPAAGPALHGAHFVLRKVVFSPSALLTTKALQAAVRPFIGQNIGQAGIGRLLDAVNALYVKRKVTTARAVLKPGVIRDGVLHVELVEGRLGKLRIVGLKHVRKSFVRRRIHLKPGEVVNTQALRDNLAYINRTTNLRVQAALRPGQAFGQTNVLLDVAEPGAHNISVFVDNNGVDSTGRLREGVDGHVYGLLGDDDMLAVDLVHSRGANDGVIAYSLPVTPSDGSLSVQVARSQINVNGGAFRNIDIKGRSTTESVGYTQPFIATVRWLVSGIGQYALEDSKTNIVGQRIANTHTRQMILGASVNYRREGEAWGITQLVSRLHSNEPLLGKSSFLVAPGSAFFIQRLWSKAWALRVDAGWQWSSSKNIPSANLFEVGGIGSVRGYERGVLAGPRGYYADLELHRSFGQHLDVYGFVDHGTILSFYPTNVNITGSGIGAFYSYHRWLSVSADVAKPVQTVVPGQSGVRINARVTVHWR